MFARRVRRCLFGVALLSLVCAAWVGTAGAATYVVNSTADEVDAAPGDGVCEAALGTGSCTLRAALQESNASVAADTVVLPAAIYLLALAGFDEEAAASGDLDVVGSLALVGAGAANTVIDAARLDRVLDIAPAAVATVSGLTLRGGCALSTTRSENGGGGIANRGTLTLHGAVVTANAGVAVAPGSPFVCPLSAALVGGGIANYGSLTIERSTISGNIIRYRGLSGQGGGIWNEGTLTLTASTVAGNDTFGASGGLANVGTATLVDSTISANRSIHGGGVANSGELTVRNSVIADNLGGGLGGGQGGGLWNIGTLRLESSTVSGNSAVSHPLGPALGAGIANLGTLVATNSTVSGNAADRDEPCVGAPTLPRRGCEAAGGGLWNSGTATLANVTLTANSADEGGGIASEAGSVSAANTIVAGNTSAAVAADCAGALASLGHNLIGSLAGCTVTGDQSGDLVAVEPLLGPLADNGGPTPTHALLPGSPAIDAASPVTTGGAGACAATDQRGVARPQAAGCDIGAFERVLSPDATPPRITATVVGTLGQKGWYTSDVSVSWSVSDPESSISSSSGCEPATVTSDTAGTFTCTANSAGGTASESVPIRRDATPPTVTCAASPSRLWPPNHQLLPVAITVRVSDALSGAAGFVLQDVSSSERGAGTDIDAWTLGAADTAGRLRAERSGAGTERTYTLTYAGSDLAGNSATCAAVATVPHSRRRD